ncbi:MAG: DNA topology modulation protein FlaR, partial [Geminicoccaceae bacterium]
NLDRKTTLMKRVMIVGGPGSGKSTLARMLGEITGLPIFHMDHIHWKPGWVERTQDEKNRLAHEVHRREEWIFEGNHSRTYAERIERADTLIWLDFPLALRLWRVLWRSAVSYGKTRPDMAEGCPERFGAGTIEFIAFIWRTRHSSRMKIKKTADHPPSHLTVYHLQHRTQIKRFLNDMRNRI